MPSIDTHDVFAELNIQFEEKYDDAVMLNWSNSAECEKMEFAPFSIFYNHPDNYNVECIISRYVEQISDIIDNHYEVDWEYDNGTYYINFAPRPPKHIKQLPCSDMGVVDI
jgi:hypothetical protein